LDTRHCVPLALFSIIARCTCSIQAFLLPPLDTLHCGPLALFDPSISPPTVRHALRRSSGAIGSTHFSPPTVGHAPLRSSGAIGSTYSPPTVGHALRRSSGIVESTLSSLRGSARGMHSSRSSCGRSLSSCASNARLIGRYGICRFICLVRYFAAADPCSAVSSIECVFSDSQTLLQAGVQFTQLSSCTYKNPSIFRHNPWVWMPAQMLLHVCFSIISQGLDASSKAAPRLLHQTHRVWMPAPVLLHVFSIKLTGSAPHRCCTLLKTARYASGCVDL
jgi:hypothetical protein